MKLKKKKNRKRHGYLVVCNVSYFAAFWHFHASLTPFGMFLIAGWLNNLFYSFIWMITTSRIDKKNSKKSCHSFQLCNEQGVPWGLNRNKCPSSWKGVSSQVKNIMHNWTTNNMFNKNNMSNTSGT
jgi:hypothetical protein